MKDLLLQDLFFFLITFGSLFGGPALFRWFFPNTLPDDLLWPIGILSMFAIIVLGATLT